MRPITVPSPVPSRVDRATQTQSPTPAPAPPSCWYLDPAHRPRLGWCPDACHGPPTYAERLGNGDRHVYCETHAHWRRQTIRLPTLVWRMPSGGAA